MNTDQTGSLGDRRTLAAHGATAPEATLAAGEAFGAECFRGNNWLGHLFIISRFL
jgi:hypothetical protein